MKKYDYYVVCETRGDRREDFYPMLVEAVHAADKEWKHHFTWNEKKNVITFFGVVRVEKNSLDFIVVKEYHI